MTNRPESALLTPEKKKRVHPKRWISAALASVALSGCSGSSNSFPKESFTAPDNITNLDVEQPNTPDQELRAIPNEAKGWVAEYGNRYADPVSTFYAEMGYEKKYGKPTIISNKDVSEYEITYGTSGDTSPLGFTMGTLELGGTIDQEVSMRLFNSYEAPNLSLYMNLLARNPASGAVAMIEEQFLAYSQGQDLLSVGGVYDERAGTRTRKIMDTMASIVNKYGSNAIYSIAPAVSGSVENPDSTNSVFFFAGQTDVYTNGLGFMDNIEMLVFVDTYVGDRVVRSKEVFGSLQMIVEFQSPPGTADTFGYLTFGEA